MALPGGKPPSEDVYFLPNNQTKYTYNRMSRSNFVFCCPSFGSVNTLCHVGVRPQLDQ